MKRALIIETQSITKNTNNNKMTTINTNFSIVTLLKDSTLQSKDTGWLNA